LAAPGQGVRRNHNSIFVGSTSRRNGGRNGGETRGSKLLPKEGIKMGDLSRIGVAIDTELLRRFDRFIAKKGYENRSEAFRDLIRGCLVGSAVVAPDAFVVGTVTLIYDHHTRLLPEKLTGLQHEHHHVIISTLHAHLDHESCLEVVVLRGKSKEVQKLADRLISIKGVQHGRLVMSSPQTAAHHSTESGER
jgi:CopG family transcriptional regulator, nickel-responsive regulator